MNVPEGSRPLFVQDIATEPHDGDDPEIYSLVKSCGPYSFVDETQEYKEEEPPPTYLKYDELNIKLPTEKEDLFKDTEVCNHGGLRCVDEEAMNQQKGVLKDVVKALAKNFLKGRGISHMSLPVRMFEPKSTTQRVVDIFSFGPVYLKKAAQIDDPLERFKHVIAVSIAGMHLCIG